MKNLDQYKKSNHKIFTHEMIRKGKSLNIIFVYRNKGYAGKSKIYGDIFQITGKDIEGTITLKTKAQVIKYLS